MAARAASHLDRSAARSARSCSSVVSGRSTIARGLLSLAEQLGHGDAVRAMLDAELASARQATDAALARKHGHP